DVPRARGLLGGDQPSRERRRSDLSPDDRPTLLRRLQGHGRPQAQGRHRRDGECARFTRGCREHDRVHRPEAGLAPMKGTITPALVGIILVALSFDFVNGFHDAANSIATVVSTRVLSPRIAVLWAAFFNFVAFLVFGTRVAKSIGDGVRMDLISPELGLYVLLAALLGAIVWNLITWYLGLPT